MEQRKVNVIGAGLAGSEAAYQLAKAGFKVNLYEMRPVVQTGAHTTDQFAELICSNSLGSNLPDRAAGVLKNELRRLGSLLMQIADEFDAFDDLRAVAKHNPHDNNEPKGKEDI